MLARDKSATKPYIIGLTYRVAAADLICRTTKVLETANQNGVATEDQAERLGCLMLDPARTSKVALLDKDPNLLKVASLLRISSRTVMRVGRTFRRLVPSQILQNESVLRSHTRDDRLSGMDRRLSPATSDIRGADGAIAMSTGHPVTAASVTILSVGYRALHQSRLCKPVAPDIALCRRRRPADEQSGKYGQPILFFFCRPCAAAAMAFWADLNKASLTEYERCAVRFTRALRRRRFP
jgi:hypothetical protein